MHNWLTQVVHEMKQPPTWHEFRGRTARYRWSGLAKLGLTIEAQLDDTSMALIFRTASPKASSATLNSALMAIRFFAASLVEFGNR